MYTTDTRIVSFFSSNIRLSVVSYLQHLKNDKQRPFFRLTLLSLLSPTELSVLTQPSLHLFTLHPNQFGRIFMEPFSMAKSPHIFPRGAPEWIVTDSSLNNLTIS